jgi:hypothetical protein
MLLLIIASLNPLIFHRTVHRNMSQWDEAAAAPWRARLTAYPSLTLWSGIIVAGRAIEYF